jgi:hypothetical protein
MTKAPFVILASILVSGVSQAATVTCTGDILNYSFTVTSKTNGAKVGPTVLVVVTKDRQPNRKGSMPVVSSVYNATTLNFMAKGGANSIDVKTTRAEGGVYTGSIAATGPEGNATIGTTCSVR